MMRAKKSAGYVCAMIGIVFAFGGACTVGEEVGDEEETVEEFEDQVFTVTAVQLDEVNGNKVIGTYTETLSEQLERNARIAELEAQGLGQDAQAISQADPCFAGPPFADQQIIIYDSINYTGNRICFVGTGVADLDSYCRTSFLGACLDEWGGNVRSFHTNNEDARFGSLLFDSSSLCCQFACGAHADDEDVTPASACEQLASTQYLDRGSVSCSTCIE